jgi:hypothetical protein
VKRYNVTFVTPSLVHILTVDAADSDEAIDSAKTLMPDGWLHDTQEITVEEA